MTPCLRRSPSPRPLHLVCAALAALAVSAPAFAAGAPAVVHTPAVSSVLDDVAAARAHIAAGQLASAADDLGAPKDLLGSLLGGKRVAAEAHRGLRDALQGAESKSPAVLLEQIRPVLETLDPVAEGEPAWQSRQQLHRAEKLLEKGDRKDAIADLKLADAKLGFTEEELPLADAYARVSAAAKELRLGQAQRADAQLAALESEATVRPLGAGAAAAR